jgi:hypothetical protein
MVPETTGDCEKCGLVTPPELAEVSRSVPVGVSAGPACISLDYPDPVVKRACNLGRLG